MVTPKERKHKLKFL